MWPGQEVKVYWPGEDRKRLNIIEGYKAYDAVIEGDPSKFVAQPASVTVRFLDDNRETRIPRSILEVGTNIKQLDFKNIVVNVTKAERKRREQTTKRVQPPPVAEPDVPPQLLDRPDDKKVFAAALEKTTGFVVLKCKGDEDCWRMPWVRFKNDTAKDDLFLGVGNRGEWHADVFKDLEVETLYERPEDGVADFFIGDAEAFQAWAACRNVLLAYRRSQSEGQAPVGYVTDVLRRSKFVGTDAINVKGKQQATMLSGIKELIAWLFTINFAGRNVPGGHDGVGWQWSHQFLINFNQAIKLTSAGAEDTAERSFNEGLDPANSLGASVYPNDGIDGKVTGAAKLWSAELHNNFALNSDAAWDFKKAEYFDLLAAVPSRPVMQLPAGRRIKAPTPKVLNSSLSQIRGEVLVGELLEEDDGGSKALAADQDQKDREMCKVTALDEPCVHNPAASFESASPVTSQMASLFGTLSHEWALTELLGAVYAGDLKQDEAEMQMANIISFVSQFPDVCVKVGNVLAAKLVRETIRNLPPESAVDVNGTVLSSAVGSVVSVDLLSAVPYTYPPLAAVPDGLFKCTASNNVSKLVVAEFKTQWRKSGKGFRWSMGDGKAYRRQALFEAVAHWLTAGQSNPDGYVPVEAWAVVVKTPSEKRVKKCKAYAACCSISNYSNMLAQTQALYAAIFDGPKQKAEAGMMTTRYYWRAAQVSKRKSKKTRSLYSIVFEPGAIEKSAADHFTQEKEYYKYNAEATNVWFQPNLKPNPNAAAIELGRAWTRSEDPLQATRRVAMDAAACSCQLIERTWMGQLVACLEEWQTPGDGFEPPTPAQLGTVEILLSGAYNHEADGDQQQPALQPGEHWTLQLQETEPYDLRIVSATKGDKLEDIFKQRSGQSLLGFSAPTRLLYKVVSRGESGGMAFLPVCSSRIKGARRIYATRSTDVRQESYKVYWTPPAGGADESDGDVQCKYNFKEVSKSFEPKPGWYLEPLLLFEAQESVLWPPEATFMLDDVNYQASAARLNRDINRALERRR